MMHDNARPEGRRVFGFPDFIPTVEAEYPRFFEVGPRVLTAMHSVADREYAAPEPHQRAILTSSMLAGLPGLMEPAINGQYFRLRPQNFEDYREWVHVERFRKIEFVREHLPLVFTT